MPRGHTRPAESTPACSLQRSVATPPLGPLCSLDSQIDHGHRPVGLCAKGGCTKFGVPIWMYEDSQRISVIQMLETLKCGLAGTQFACPAEFTIGLSRSALLRHRPTQRSATLFASQQIHTQRQHRTAGARSEYRRGAFYAPVGQPDAQVKSVMLTPRLLVDGTLRRWTRWPTPG